MSEIRARVIDSGSHYFDRATLRFFGETMRNFVAGPVREDGKQYVYRNGGKAGNKTMLFDPMANRLSNEENA